MSFNPDKLKFDFLEETTPIEPIIGRKYTLTHSDDTGELFLSIGLQFDYDKVTDMRDEVLAEWRIYNRILFLYVYVNVDGELEDADPKRRNEIFRKEMSLALSALRCGDQAFYNQYPVLDDSQIWIQFYSKSEELNKFEHWGSPKDYLISKVEID